MLPCRLISPRRVVSLRMKAISSCVGSITDVGVPPPFHGRVRHDAREPPLRGNRRCTAEQPGVLPNCGALHRSYRATVRPSSSLTATCQSRSRSPPPSSLFRAVRPARESLSVALGRSKIRKFECGGVKCLASPGDLNLKERHERSLCIQPSTDHRFERFRRVAKIRLIAIGRLFPPRCAGVLLHLPPSAADWAALACEIKHDGFRFICRR